MIFRIIPLLLLLVSSSLAHAQNKSLTPSAIPGGFGVHIHFADPKPGEMKMLAESGVKWVRKAFLWQDIEKEKGVYDFAPYDRLMKALDEHGIRPIFTLSFDNPHYDQGLAPYTNEGRQAFTQWAMASVKHFAARGIVWEMWNEPNYLIFWRPKPKTEDYILLAETVGKAFRSEFPEEILIGPATAHIPLNFLVKCFKAGLLEYWSGVSVHPYRVWLPPETAPPAYQRVRSRIKKYAPSGKDVALIVGEWGYSSTQYRLDETRQAKFLARQWLLNVAEQIPISIWYDWKNDGTEAHNNEHNFGLIRFPVEKNGAWNYEPKPAYYAAQSLSTHLKGYEFDRRLSVGGNQDYLFEFKNGEARRWAAWTSSLKSREVKLKLPAGDYAVFDYLGKSLDPIRSRGKAVSITLRDGPIYILPAGSSH